MLALPADGALVALLRASEANLVELLRLFAGQPGMSFVEAEGPLPDDGGVRFLNLQSPPESNVLRTRWPTDGVEERIEAEIRCFEAAGVGVDWLLFPPVSPADLPERLEARGLARGSTRWLLADLTALPEPPPVPEGLSIVAAETPAEMAVWRQATTAGFGVSEAVGQRFHDAYVSGPRESNRVALRRHYVGMVEGVPVSSSMLLLAAGIACIWDVSTPPEYRRKGYGSCLTRAALEDARRMGYRYASLNSSNLGYSMYCALGFTTEFAITELCWSPEG